MENAVPSAYKQEQRTLSVHSCGICEELMQQLLQPTISHYDYFGNHFAQSINVGWLDSLMENTQCTLCCLITCIYKQVRRQDVPKDKRVYCEMGRGPVKIDSSGRRCDWSISLDFFIPEPDPDAGDSTDDLWSPSFRLLADDVAQIDVDIDVSRLGRLHEDLDVDRTFIRSCYETCIRDHGSACNEPIRENTEGDKFPLSDLRPLPRLFRVIDVDSSMVTLAPLDCTFAILSYVWGGTNFLTLQTNNREELEVKDSLKYQSIPKTIADAMEVARILRIRYLWVDSLCILQDDEDDKAAQIQQMDNIYSKAILTIVAASKEAHADGGLWKSLEIPRSYTQIVREVQGLRFVGTAPPVEGLILESRWHHRAWTYQESVLSKRLLIFTYYQAYYLCNIANFAQDCIQSCASDGSWQEAPCYNNVDSQMQSYALSDFPNSYHTLVRDFTVRQLSYESDGLNAVTGVLRNFGRGIHEGFLCGLPVSTLFEYGMLWYVSATINRRGPSQSGTPFPSWSWVGWTGPVDWNFYDKVADLLDARIITEWSLEYDSGTLQSKCLHFPSAAGKLTSSASLEETQLANLSLGRIQTGILCFETKSATFFVEKEPWNQNLLFDSSQYPEKGLYRIKSGDSWIGSVHLELSAIVELSIRSGTSQEFIVLSGSGGKISPAEVHKTTSQDEDGSTIVYYFSEDLMRENECEVYNVMMIIWEKGIAYRRGIGQIHKNSFNEAKWNTKSIRLG
jgi:hypothetical protein